MPDGLASGHPEELHGEGVSGWGLLLPYIAEMGLQELAKGLPAPQWRNDTKQAGCCQPFLHHSATSHTCSPAFAQLHFPHSRNLIPFFRDLLSALHSPPFFSIQDTLICTAPPPLHCLTVLSPDFPPLLSPSPFTATVSSLLCFCLLGWRLGERNHSHLFFCPCYLVQGLPLHTGGETEYPPCSLPHEEVLLCMVWSVHGRKKYLTGEDEDCYWT